jgi:hypothetical protein
MEKRILIICLLTLTFAPLFSQSLICKQGLQVINNDLLARTNPRLDENGKPSAVIKVNSTLTDLKFESTYIIGNIAYAAGQYVIYMAEGAKNLKVFKEGYLPCTIVFSDNSKVKYTQSQVVYSLVIGEFRQFGELNVISEPAGASVYVDGNYLGSTPLQSQIQIGNHNVRIVKDRYATKEYAVEIKEGKSVRIFEKMSMFLARLQINTDDVTSVFIDDIFVGKGNYDQELTRGTHNIKVSYKDNIVKRSLSKTIKLQDDQVEDLYLLGSLLLDETKTSFTNVNVTLSPNNGNGKNKRDTITSIKTNNLYGNYKVTTSRYGYWSSSKNINIHEKEEAIYTIPNLQKNQRLTFFNYQYSPKSNLGFMLGWCNKAGVYISGRVNLKFIEDKTSESGYSITTDSINKQQFGLSSWSIDIGPMFRLAPWLYLHSGVGYGTYNSNGKTFNEVYTKGFNAELGLDFVIRGFTINLGYNTICNKSITQISPLSNLHLGLGIGL